MQKKLRFFELDSDEGYFLADEAMLKAAGLDNPATLESTFGGQGKLITITLHQASQRLQRQIVRETITPQDDGSLKEDVLKTPLVRACVMIERWEESTFPVGTTFPITKEVTADFIDELPPIFANTLDLTIQLHLFPNVFTNSAFTSALQTRSKPSETAAK